MTVATSLYRHFAADGSLLYVGISLSWPMRTKAHASGSRWFSEVAQVTIERFPTREEAIEAEREAIRRERPRFNIIHNRTASLSSRLRRQSTNWRFAESVPKLKTRLAPDTASLLLDQIAGPLALVGPPLVYHDDKLSLIVAWGCPAAAGELTEVILGTYMPDPPAWTASCASVITMMRPDDIKMEMAKALRREIVWHLRKRIKVEVFDTDLALAAAYAARFPSTKSKQIFSEIAQVVPA